MSKNKLKTYVPQTRRDLIAAVTQWTHLLGITAIGLLPNCRLGDVVVIDVRGSAAQIATSRQPRPRRAELETLHSA
jgi:hypothetical protein